MKWILIVHIYSWLGGNESANTIVNQEFKTKSDCLFAYAQLQKTFNTAKGTCLGVSK